MWGRGASSVLKATAVMGEKSAKRINIAPERLIWTHCRQCGHVDQET